jgi:hypothetical protein
VLPVRRALWGRVALLELPVRWVLRVQWDLRGRLAHRESLEQLVQRALPAIQGATGVTGPQGPAGVGCRMDAPETDGKCGVWWSRV